MTNTFELPPTGLAHLQGISVQDALLWFITAALAVAWILRGYSRSALSTIQNGFQPAEFKDRTIRMNINDHLETTQNDCIVFFGSQTGTAEGLAVRFAREARARFGLRATTADLSDFDMESLSQIHRDKIAVFFLASFGDGEPTDNAKALTTTLTELVARGGTDLADLKYAMFGLGSRDYEFFNAMACNTDESLRKVGATRLGRLGESDESQGTVEDQFITWKEEICPLMANSLGLDQETSNGPVELATTVKPVPEMSASNPEVALGERINMQGSRHRNTVAVPLLGSRDLFTSGDRDCLHLEFDAEASGLQYETGDHLVLWPSNSDLEVLRFLKVLGLESQATSVIRITSGDENEGNQTSLPSLTTYDALARHYLDICGVVKRQSLKRITPYAPSDTAASKIRALADSPDLFRLKVVVPARNLAHILEDASSGAPWPALPVALLAEELALLTPRSYSISSSSLEQPSIVSVTVGVERELREQDENPFLGVSSNFLLALACAQRRGQRLSTHDLAGPRGLLEGFRVPMHVQKSSFRLPCNLVYPVIMIGAGTGVAPFRGFIRERALQLEKGGKVGKTVMFFGCRQEEEDFIYRDEWKTIQERMGDTLEIITAFSRTGKSKCYVQHKVGQEKEKIARLLGQDAHVYVCGNAANMAKAVREEFIHIFQEFLRMTPSEAESHMKLIKKAKRYQEDIW